jgi:hypothetical protein
MKSSNLYKLFYDRYSNDLGELSFEDRESVIKSIVIMAEDAGYSTDDLLQLMIQDMGFFEILLLVLSKEQDSNEEKKDGN